MKTYGEYSTFTGIETTYLLTGPGDVSTTTANTSSGCRVTEWAGNPQMVRDSSAPDAEYVAASGDKTALSGLYQYESSDRVRLCG